MGETDAEVGDGEYDFAEKEIEKWYNVFIHRNIRTFP